MPGTSYLIKGGTIIDGSGFPMAKGDIAVTGETIKSVGGMGGSATRVIDAAGKYIMPGVIDITNHSDTHWTLFSVPSQESLLRQGITTVIGGMCGSSLAPLIDPQSIRGIQKWIDISKINVNWRSEEEFFTELEKHQIGVNFGSLVGHGTLRRGIAGDSMRALSREEVEEMKLILRRALDEGAMGLSLGLATSHGGAAPQEEFVALGKVVADTNKLVAIHLRNEGRQLLSSVVEAVNLARATGAEIQISHFKAIGRKAWDDLKKALAVIRKAREDEKLSIWVDFFPYLRTGSLLYTFLPEWMREGGKESIVGVLMDPQKKSSVLDALGSLTLHYDNIIIAEAQRDKHAVGKSIAQIAHDAGISPEETVIQLLSINGLGVSIFGRTLNAKNVCMIARESYSMFGSDGVGEDVSSKKKGDLTHPRSYGAAPRFLARLVRRGNILSWEEAVKKMTSLPASRLGIDSTHGFIKKGYSADIVIFDPDTVEDTATYKNPYQYPNGIEYVFVNGHLAIEKGTFTQALAGKILRRA